MIFKMEIECDEGIHTTCGECLKNYLIVKTGKEIIDFEGCCKHTKNDCKKCNEKEKR